MPAIPVATISPAIPHLPYTQEYNTVVLIQYRVSYNLFLKEFTVSYLHLFHTNSDPGCFLMMPEILIIFYNFLE